MRDWLGLPVAASAEAAVIDDTLVLVHWLMLVLFAGWTIYFIVSIVRGRRPQHVPSVAPSARWPALVIFLVLATEIALLAFVDVPFWRARTTAPLTTPQATIVRVVAEQFAWNIHYPGPDGRFGRTRADLITADNPLGLDRSEADARDDVSMVNELHVPVGSPVIVYVTSKDVVHSFTLNEMRVKQDAIPGLVQTVWFTPTRTGSWEIGCSQLCGLAHYRMRGIFVSEPQSDFAAWLEAAVRARP